MQHLQTGVTVYDDFSGLNSNTDFTYSPSTLNYGNNNITYKATDKAGNTTEQVRVLTYEYVVCFISGTKISTPIGFINIEYLKEGDLVNTINETTGKIEIKPIIKTLRRQSNELAKIYIENGEQITNTLAHPYYIDQKGWTETKDLNVGDKILTQNKFKRKISKINTFRTKGTDVYNLTIKDNHNYFVGYNRLLVHNYEGGAGCGLEDYPVD